VPYINTKEPKIQQKPHHQIGCSQNGNQIFDIHTSYPKHKTFDAFQGWTGMQHIDVCHKMQKTHIKNSGRMSLASRYFVIFRIIL
jgi:hypothetical protein